MKNLDLKQFADENRLPIMDSIQFKNWTDELGKEKFRELLSEYIAEYSPDALFAEGLDDAIIGVVERFAMSPVVLYDRDECVEILMGQDMTYEEAEEFFDYNVIGSWVGDGTPCFAILIKNNFSS